MVDLEEVRRFLAEPNLAVLSTVSRRGSPHAVVVHFEVVGGELLVNGRSDRTWVANLRRDPKVSCLVHDHAELQHWVAVEGTVSIVYEGTDSDTDASRLAERYGEDPAQFVGQRRVSFRIVPDRILEYRPSE